MCFVDATYGNEPTKRIPNNGFSFTFYGGEVVYRSKTQLINELSSTESDIVAAVTTTNTYRLFRSTLQELGFPQESPNPI